MIRERLVSVLRSAPLIALLIAFVPTGLPAQTADSPELQTEEISSGLRNVSAVASSGSDLWVAEGGGRVLRISAATGHRVVAATLADMFQPESRAIYDIVLDPSFADSLYLYVHYPYLRTYPNLSWKIYSKVVRLRYDTSSDRLVEPRTILDSITSSEWNVGGRMVALDDRTLILVSGDGLDYAEEAQQMNTTRGKVLRVNLDGTVPSDNPFVNLRNPLRAIVARGLHNPTAVTFSPTAGGVLFADRGTSVLDEINLLESGANYGWNLILGKCDGYPLSSELEHCEEIAQSDPYYVWYKAEGMVPEAGPMLEYRNGPIDHFNRSLLVATERDGVHLMEFDSVERRIRRLVRYDLPSASGGRDRPVRDICMDESGELYLAVDGAGESADRILRVVGADVPSPPQDEPEIQLRTVADSLEIPWDMVWGYDNRIWMTERIGRVSRLDPESGERSVLLSIDPVQVENTGLLGLALHPAFCDSPYVYLVYTYGDSLRKGLLLERLSRFRYDESADTLVEETVLLDGIRVSGQHAGSRLAMGRDRHLFMSVGDGDRTDSVQSVASLLGKILRLHIDGTPPDDNPFSGQGFPAEYIWSVGHRNSQGLVIAPDGTLYASEHGPVSDDEVNRILPGRNYGWADVLGFCDTPYEERYCEEFNIMEPMIAWTPTIAPAGLDFYDSDAIPLWKGKLLMTTLKTGRLMVFDLSDDGTEIDRASIYFPYEFGRIRDVCVAPDGRVFISTSNRDVQGAPRPGDDRIIEISSSAGHPPLPSIGMLCDTMIIDTTSSDTGKVSVPFRSPERVVRGNVFPIPVRNVARIEFDQAIGSGELTLHTTDGRRVLRLRTEPGRVIEFGRGDLPSGRYIAEIRTAEAVFRLLLLLE